MNLGVYFIKKNQYINKKYATSPFIIPIPFTYDSNEIYDLHLDLKYSFEDSGVPLPPNTGATYESKDKMNTNYTVLIAIPLSLIVLFMYKKRNDSDTNETTK